MTWRRLTLPIALAVMLAGCMLPAPVVQPEQSIRLVPGVPYTFVYSCVGPFGCAGEVVVIASGPHDGWVKLADGRVVNLRLVLAISPYEPPSEPPEESSPALRVKL